MLQFLQPIWFLAAAAIVVPFAIHWWNNRQRKTLLVGSIRLFTANTKKRVQKRRLSEWWLLLVRCILLIVLAVLLSQPVWNNIAAAKKEKGWILITKSELSFQYHQHQSLIDSLINSGFQFHYFELGFASGSLHDTLTTGMPLNDSLNYRTLFVQAEQTAPRGIPLYIFTDNRLKRFGGMQSSGSGNVQWFLTEKPGAVQSWIRSAYLTASDSIRIETSVGNGEGINHRTLVVTKALGSTNEIKVDVVNGKLAVANSNGQPVAVDTGTAVITIFTEHYWQDARYCKAAIDAIQQFTDRKLRVIVTGDVKQIPARTQWLFWLSEKPVPAAVEVQNLLQYETGSIEKVTTSLITANKVSGTPHSIIYRRIAADQDKGIAIWKDGFGQPLLSMEKSNERNVYHFYSHFDPAWNDLCWCGDFPFLLMNLLYRDAEITFRENDTRMIAAAQVQPYQAKVNELNSQYVSPVSTHLSGITWWLLLALFVLERILAFKKQQTATDA